MSSSNRNAYSSKLEALKKMREVLVVIDGRINPKNEVMLLSQCDLLIAKLNEFEKSSSTSKNSQKMASWLESKIPKFTDNVDRLAQALEKLDPKLAQELASYRNMFKSGSPPQTTPSQSAVQSSTPSATAQTTPRDMRKLIVSFESTFENVRTLLATLETFTDPANQSAMSQNRRKMEDQFYEMEANLKKIQHSPDPADGMTQAIKDIKQFAAAIKQCEGQVRAHDGKLADEMGKWVKQVEAIPMPRVNLTALCDRVSQEATAIKHDLGQVLANQAARMESKLDYPVDKGRSKERRKSTDAVAAEMRNEGASEIEISREVKRLSHFRLLQENQMGVRKGLQLKETLGRLINNLDEVSKLAKEVMLPENKDNPEKLTKMFARMQGLVEEAKHAIIFFSGNKDLSAEETLSSLTKLQDNVNRLQKGLQEKAHTHTKKATLSPEAPTVSTPSPSKR